MDHQYANANVECINPFVSATFSVFRTMLSSDLKRGKLYLKEQHCPAHDISGVIGLSGKAVGTVVLTLSRTAALGVTEAMLGEKKLQIDPDVVDAVGEVVNMIAGNAKAQFEHLDLQISLPNVVIGKNHVVAFPTGVALIGIPFDSKWGRVCIEVGMCAKRGVSLTPPEVSDASRKPQPVQ